MTRKKDREAKLKAKLPIHKEKLGGNNTRLPIPKSSVGPSAQAVIRTPRYDAPPSVLEIMLDWLPSEILENIFAQLSLTDVHHLRLAGAGAGHAATHSILRTMMRRRVRSLQTILNAMTAHEVIEMLKRSTPMDIRLGFVSRFVMSKSFSQIQKALSARLQQSIPPAPSTTAELALPRQYLCIQTLTPDIARAIASELPTLRFLRVLWPPTTDPVDSTDLPGELASILTLTMLQMHKYFGIMTFPKVILKLHNLEILVLSDFAKLLTLPEDMGDKLPLLRYVELSGCGLRSVPRSLLSTLERNFKVTSTRHGIYAPFNNFEDLFWGDEVKTELFPNLSEHVRESYGAFHPRQYVL